MIMTSLFYSGLDSFPAGRRGDSPSIGLSNTLAEAGFSLSRLKTGLQCVMAF